MSEEIKRPSSIKDCRFRLSYSTEDMEWVATCDEFPSLSFLDTDSLMAVSNIIDLVYDTIEEIKSEERRR